MMKPVHCEARGASTQFLDEFGPAVATVHAIFSGRFAGESQLLFDKTLAAKITQKFDSRFAMSVLGSRR
jgi:hypothetical protein